MNPTLVILAAGLGSRYGADKQLAGVGPQGEPILHFTACDAARSGFGELVLVVRPELESATEALVGAALRRVLPVRYVHQRADQPLPGMAAPGRQRPWGTGHAVACAVEGLSAPCGVVNADDWYGPPAIADLAGLLATASEAVSLVAFRLGRTLSPHGGVNRGLVALADGQVRAVTETRGLVADGGRVRDASGATHALGTPVSMNLWALRPSAYASMRERVRQAIAAHADDPLWECQLPDLVMAGLQAGDWRVAARLTDADWCGLTYAADRPAVRRRLAAAVAVGACP